MMTEVGQSLRPMVDPDGAAPPTSACLDDDRALALVDGQLSVEDREEIEAHLDVCTACRRFVSELAKESLFASPTELPTEVERTGYAPGRVGGLDLALTARDVAATRVGLAEPEVRREDSLPRRAELPRAPRDEPKTPGGATLGPRSTSAARGLDTSVRVLVAVTLSLLLVTVLAALISLGALGYVISGR